mmetsp:Transcript_22489/g.48834  ORF Transcript_22489/g.48834 Transcript_22489/m.48834 type:complete len:186 (+) Transcript_22489:121-678(+)
MLGSTRYVAAFFAISSASSVGCQAFHPIIRSISRQIVFTSNTRTSTSSTRPTKLFAGSDKELEIAELEERLAQLKAEEASAPVAAALTGEGDDDDTRVEIPPASSAPDDSFDMNVYRKRVANIKEPPPGEFLSEAWKESVEEQPGVGDTLKTLGLGLGIVLALVAFSQIPVGDEGLAKYSEKIGL